MKPETYAEALLAMVKGGATPHDAVQSLGRYLSARGKSGMLKRLPAALERKGAAAAAKSRAILEVAYEDDAATARKEAAAFGGEHAEVRADEALIGGWRLVSHSTLVDNSFKRHLLDIYKQITR